MYEKIRSVYEEYVKDREEDEISIKLRKEICEMLKKYVVDEKEINEWLDMTFRIAEAGEEAGFIRGFRYAVQLIIDCK